MTAPGPLLRSLFVLVLSSALVCALGLHTLQIEHVHPGSGAAHGERDHTLLEISTYTHALEEKFFLLMLFIISVGVLVSVHFGREHQSVFTQIAAQTQLLRQRSSSSRYPKVNYLLECFRKGILKPKLPN